MDGKQVAVMYRPLQFGIVSLRMLNGEMKCILHLFVIVQIDCNIPFSA